MKNLKGVSGSRLANKFVNGPNEFGVFVSLVKVFPNILLPLSRLFSLHNNQLHIRSKQYLKIVVAVLLILSFASIFAPHTAFHTTLTGLTGLAGILTASCIAIISIKNLKVDLHKNHSGNKIKHGLETEPPKAGAKRVDHLRYAYKFRQLFKKNNRSRWFDRKRQSNQPIRYTHPIGISSANYLNVAVGEAGVAENGIMRRPLKPLHSPECRGFKPSAVKSGVPSSSVNNIKPKYNSTTQMKTFFGSRTPIIVLMSLLMLSLFAAAGAATQDLINVQRKAVNKSGASSCGGIP